VIRRVRDPHSCLSFGAVAVSRQNQRPNRPASGTSVSFGIGLVPIGLRTTGLAPRWTHTDPSTGSPTARKAPTCGIIGAPFQDAVPSLPIRSDNHNFLSDRQTRWDVLISLKRVSRVCVKLKTASCREPLHPLLHQRIRPRRLQRLRCHHLYRLISEIHRVHRRRRLRDKTLPQRRY